MITTKGTIWLKNKTHEPQKHSPGPEFLGITKIASIPKTLRTEIKQGQKFTIMKNNKNK